MGRQHSLDRAFTEQRGSVLVGGLLLVLAMTMIGVALFEAAVIETREVGFTADDVRAFYATETGLNRAALDVAWDTIQTSQFGANSTFAGIKGLLAAPGAPSGWPDNTPASSFYASTCFGLPNDATCNGSSNPTKPAYMVQAVNDPAADRFLLISTACIPGPVPDPGTAIATCPAGTKAMAQVRAWIAQGSPTVTTTTTVTTTNTVSPAMPWGLFAGGTACNAGCINLHPGNTSSYDSHKAGCSVPCPQTATNTGNNGSIASNGNVNVQGGTVADPLGHTGINGNVVGYTNVTNDSSDVELSGNINGFAKSGGTITGTAAGGTFPGSPTTQTPLPPLSNCGPPYTTLVLDNGSNGGNVVSVTGGTLSSVYTQSTGALTLNSAKTLTLKAGTYCFGNVNLQGGAQLNTSGSGVTAIYIDGILHVQNNGTMINNASQDPQNVQLIVTFGNDAGETNGQCGGNPVCLESGAVMYMTVYAPSTGVKLQGGGDIYGAIVGNTIDVTGNVTVHYDNYLINSPNLVKGIPTPMTTTTTTTTTYTTWTPAAYSVANWLKAKCKQSSLSSPWSCS